MELGTEIGFEVVKFKQTDPRYCVHSQNPDQHNILRIQECSCCGGCGEGSNALRALAEQYKIKDFVSLQALNNQLEATRIKKIQEVSMDVKTFTEKNKTYAQEEEVARIQRQARKFQNDTAVSTVGEMIRQKAEELCLEEGLEYDKLSGDEKIQKLNDAVVALENEGLLKAGNLPETEEE